MCGENPDALILHGVPAGSPPRVRGKQSGTPRRIYAVGITPACAGKTDSGRNSTPLQRDHPRVCGENSTCAAIASGVRGSPPRVRGKQHLRRDSLGREGITPACAGKTSRRPWASCRSRDHPRVCGENSLNLRLMPLAAGSPPRVRGKLGKRYGIFKENGITPACAGKTLRKWRISVVDPSPQPRSSLTFRRADASIGSQRAPCAAPV